MWYQRTLLLPYRLCICTQSMRMSAICKAPAREYLDPVATPTLMDARHVLVFSVTKTNAVGGWRCCLEFVETAFCCYNSCECSGYFTYVRKYDPTSSVRLAVRPVSVLSPEYSSQRCLVFCDVCYRCDNLGTAVHVQLN